MMTKKIFRTAAVLALAAAVSLAAVPVASCGKEPAASAMKSVTAIAFMDTDGPKLDAVAVEYDTEIQASAVSADTFALSTYSSFSCVNLGNGNPGDVTAVYVNTEAAKSASGGAKEGRYVILEMYTAYLANADLDFSDSLNVRVTQVKDIKAADGTVLPASDEYMRNTLGGGEYRISFPGFDGFEFHYTGESSYRTDGGGYYAAGCFSQQDGLYHDENLAYALYLPEDYTDSGSYALVTLQNPAADEGTHPFESVMTYRSASYYISDEAQELVRETHGVDGLIVLVPVITERVNDNGGTPAQYEALVRLWDHVIETYHVDTDCIYGSGQSVGGMVLLETNRVRDNFFAGILLYDNQWTQNYYPDTIFVRNMASSLSFSDQAEMTYPRVDPTITWDHYYDTDGNPVYDGYDPYNYYFQVSDDNIMLLNAASNRLSNNSWSEMKYLYDDLAGASLVQKTVETAATDYAEADAVIEDWAAANADGLNINWLTFSDSNCFRRVDSSYRWLLSQTRDSETRREKLDLNKPFELADTQIRTDERKLDFTDSDGNALYYLTGKAGAGTQGYSGCWLNLGSVADAAPGWLPEGMSWETGVETAHIESVRKVGSRAIAVEYDADMTGLCLNLKGDGVYNHIRGETRADDLIVVDPVGLYDSDGNRIENTVVKAYVSSEPSVRDGAEHLSGSGRYIIFEFEDDVVEAAFLAQLTTFHTARVIANASYRYEKTA